MVTTFTVVGVSGSGKTQFGMSILEKKLKEGIPWHQIGYSSYSRAACLEAAERASKITGIDPGRLQKDAFFRTIHSSALRLLGISAKLLIDPDSAAGRQFMIDVFGAPRGGDRGTLSEKIDEALSWWDVCRARLSRMVCTSAHGVTPSGPKPPSNHPKTTLKPPSLRDGVTLKSSVFGGDSEECQRFENSYLYIGGKLKLTKCFEKHIRLNGQEGGFGDRRGLSYQNPISPYRETYTTLNSSRVVLGVEGGSEKDIRSVNSHDFDKLEKYGKIIRDYEDAKRHSGKLDFTDILFRYSGIEVDSELMFRQGYQNGSVPEEIHTWIIDEYQDCSALLDMAAQRLSENAQELYLLGDAYQAVYGFSGSDAKLFAHRVCEAGENGRNILLNRTWRNPDSVVDWGEEILSEDEGYKERMPISEAGQGSVGMMHLKDLIAGLPVLAAADTMILARAWFALSKIKERLDKLCIPWSSCQEQKSSRWEAPAKIAFVLTMRALAAGDKISEQDFRRITTELPQKIDGAELFTRGTKAKWKKMQCSGENTTKLQELAEWGAAAAFREYVVSEKWRRDMFLLIDSAIEKYGVDIVRKPRIKIGSCHSVKGMEAVNVFCLATSSKKAAESDPFEEVCLRYVTVTRASKNFRVVVDLYEHANGKPLFLPCPRGYWKFEEGLPDDLGIEDGKQDPKRFYETGDQDAWGLGGEISGGNLWPDGNPRHSDLCDGEIRRDRVQGERTEANEDPVTEPTEDSFGWWNL